MAGLAGIESAGWLVVFLIALGASLIIITLTNPSGGPRIEAWFLPVLAGTGLVAFILVTHGGFVLHLIPRIAGTPSALGRKAAIAVLSIALADLVLGRALRSSMRLLSFTPLSISAVPKTALALNLALVLVAGLIGLVQMSDRFPSTERPRVTAGPATILSTHELPGSVTGLVFHGKYDGYASLGEGQIVHFRLPDSAGGALDVTTVVKGLHYPRGLAILGNRLFVADLGPLPCRPAFPVCIGTDLDPSPEAGEEQIIEMSRGRVLAFDIDPDGTLRNEYAILSELPVVDTVHGINGVAAGPDGNLYVTIGSLELLWMKPDFVDEVQRPRSDWLGTVVRVAPDGRHPEVFARGLRNVYGLAFDERGVLYGVDNDGPTVRGWRREELPRIKQGAHYGYPYEGTFGSIRTDYPVWRLNSHGAGGIAWSGRFGLSPGLLVGNCNNVERVRLTDNGSARFVASPGDVSELLRLPGCVTAIEPGPNGTIVLGVFALPDHPELGSVVRGQQPNLYVIKVSG